MGVEIMSDQTDFRNEDLDADNDFGKDGGENNISNYDMDSDPLEMIPVQKQPVVVPEKSQQNPISKVVENVVETVKAKVQPDEGYNPADPSQTDYVAHGSVKHAQMLGLIPATKETNKWREKNDLPILDWEIEDISVYGMNPNERILEIKLRQKISELTSSIIPVQSKDKKALGYMPPAWVPKDQMDSHGNPMKRTSRGIL